jgi:tRNA threonylcarbamoyladenosine biosynthesis protein TsaB
MKILAIETSCEHASLALLIDDEIVERRLEGHANHSEHLLPTLQGLLAEAQLSLGALDALAFGAGPGAFTGLRLACGVAQGLAMGAALGVVPVCSLAALALQGEGDDVFVATDARMGELYCAAYRRVDGLPVEVQPLTCSPPQQLTLPSSGHWFVIGSALRAHRAVLERIIGTRSRGWNDAAVPRAREIARIAAQQVRGGHAVPPELAAPLYVRDKVALTTSERRDRGGRA